MSNVQPIAGYASKTDAVLAMSARNVPVRDIAHCLGIAEAQVYALRSNGRDKINRAMVKPADKRLQRSSFALIMPEVAKKLAPHAARRNITIGDLASRLLEHIAHDNLVDSVMDDAEIRP